MSSVRQRIVFDTSSLIPACLNPDREPAQILRRAVLWVDPLCPISECRDTKDNKFLELAVAAQADYWVSSDVQWLEMHPFRGIQILQLAHFEPSVFEG